MTARDLHRRFQAAAALLAVALLTFAVVKSTVMQVEAATPWGSAPICSAHFGGADLDPGHAGRTACAFCAAAAHSPIRCLPEPIRRPAWVRWTPAVLAVPAAAPPPAPPAPRARGPPPRPDLLSV